MSALVTRVATVSDLPALLPVFRQFYAHFDFPWDEARKAALLTQFIQQPTLGTLWLAEAEGRVLGYALTPFYFALEFDGPVALLDEFFVVAEARGQHCGSALLRAMAEALGKQGIQRLRLEVDARHPEAQGLYERLGFRRDDRATWSWVIGQPFR